MSLKVSKNENSQLTADCNSLTVFGAPYGSRTRVAAVKGLIRGFALSWTKWHTIGKPSLDQEFNFTALSHRLGVVSIAW